MQKRKAERLYTFDKGEFVVETTLAEEALVVITNKAIYVVHLTRGKPELTVVKL